MRPPDPLGQCVEIRIGRHQEICHRRRHRARSRHLPTRHKHPRRGKRLAGLHFVSKREAGEKMRSAKRCAHVAHRDRVLQHPVDPPLHGLEPARPRAFKRRRRLRPGDRASDVGPLRIKVRLARLEDRFQDRQRIERVHRDRYTHQLRPSRPRRRRPALFQKRTERLGVGVGGGVDRQNRHTPKLSRCRVSRFIFSQPASPAGETGRAPPRLSARSNGRPTPTHFATPRRAHSPTPR